MNTIEKNMLNKILNKYYGGARLEDLHSYQQEKVLDLIQSLIDSGKTDIKDDEVLGFCPWALEIKHI